MLRDRPPFCFIISPPTSCSAGVHIRKHQHFRKRDKVQTILLATPVWLCFVVLILEELSHMQK